MERVQLMVDWHFIHPSRAKLPMKFIEKEKTRNTTYQKRKRGLKKKAFELSTLCDVPICIIIYPHTTKSSSPSSSEPEIWPPNPEKVHQILQRYQCLPREDQQRRASNLCDILESKRRKFEQDLFKLQKKTMATKYPTWHPILDTLDRGRLNRLVLDLDEKRTMVMRTIALLKAANQGFFAPDPMLSTYPFTDALPTEGFGYAPPSAPPCGYPLEFQSPLCDYRAMDSSCHQLVPFGLGSGHQLLTLSIDHEADAVHQSQAPGAGNLGFSGSNGSMPPMMWGHGNDAPQSMHMGMSLPLSATFGRLVPRLGQDGHGCYGINEFDHDPNIEYYSF